MRNTHVVIFGGTGMIGAGVARGFLAEGAEVTIPCRRVPEVQLRGARYVAGVDITQRETMLKLRGMRPEVVIHAAGVVSFRRGDAELLRAVQVEGTKRVREFVLSLQTLPTVVHVSSFAALGYGGGRMNEGAVWDWERYGNRCPYGYSKYLSHVLMGEKELGAVQLMPPLVLREEGDAFIEMLRRMAGLPVAAVPPGGNGYIFLDDLVRAVLLVARNPVAGDYVISSEGMLFSDMVRAVGGKRVVVLPAWMGKVVRGERGRAAWVTRVPDMDKMRMRYGWEAGRRLGGLG